MLVRKCKKCGIEFKFSFQDLLRYEFFNFGAARSDYLFCDACRESMRFQPKIWQSLLMYVFIAVLFIAAIFLGYVNRPH